MAQDTAHTHSKPSGHTGEQEPSGPGHRLRKATHRAGTLVNRTVEQEPSGPGHRTRQATHRAGTPVNRSQVAQDTAHATQHTEQAHQ